MVSSIPNSTTSEKKKRKNGLKKLQINASKCKSETLTNRFTVNLFKPLAKAVVAFFKLAPTDVLAVSGVSGLVSVR